MHIPFLRDRNLILRPVLSPPSLEDWLEAVRRNHANPAPEICWFMSPGSLTHIPSDQVRSIAEHTKEEAADDRAGKTALVAPGDLEFGLCRMLDTNADILEFPFQVRTFRTLEAAEEWLEVPPGRLVALMPGESAGETTGVPV